MLNEVNLHTGDLLSVGTQWNWGSISIPGNICTCRRACGYVNSDLIRCLLTAFSRLERFETKIRGILDNLDAFPPMDWGLLISYIISMSGNALVSIG